MIQELESGKSDLVDLEFKVDNQTVMSKPIAIRTESMELSNQASWDFGTLVYKLLTKIRCGSKQKDRTRLRRRRRCYLQPKDRDSQVVAGYALRSIYLQALKLGSYRRSAIVLSDLQNHLVLHPFSCVLGQKKCNNDCSKIYQAALSDRVLLQLQAAFPRRLWKPRTSLSSDSSLPTVSYSLTDIVFFGSLHLITIRPRCGSTGYHLTTRGPTRDDSADSVFKCENHTQDLHSDCDSDSELDDVDVFDLFSGFAREDVQVDTMKRASAEEQSVVGDEPAAEDELAEEENVEETFIPTRTPTSPAELEWIRIKEKDGVENRALDEIMDMIGLEDVKLYLLQLLGKTNTIRRQQLDLSQERLGTLFLGNPGTGKTTVARLYGKFLTHIGALPGSKFVEKSGVLLARDGVHAAKTLVESVYFEGSRSRTGGTFFVDDAYQLMEHSSKGVVDYLLSEIEIKKGKIAFVFAGYDKQMEKFLAYNPGMSSRLPHHFRFTDFKQSELLALLQQNVIRRYQDRMNIEDGPDGLYMRIVSSRLDRRGGKAGFGNARDVENVFDGIIARQATRLEALRKSGEEFDDFLLTKEDVIGSEPSNALTKSDAFAKLHRMVGLHSVKRSLQDLVDRHQDNYKRELKELPIVEAGLNRLFLGSPGTGKTTVAKLYGQILAEIGLLSTTDVVLKVAADFIGQYIGDSEMFTRQILEAAKGKVLIIDEAYMLGGSKRAGRYEPDEYRQGVIDTLLSMVQGHPGEDRAVLLLGYEDQMMDFLRDCNPGLMRRFPPESAFFFEDYNDDELRSILDTKLEDQGIGATKYAREIAIDVLSKCRRRPNFGNAGEIDNLLGRAKARFQRRMSHMSVEERTGEVVLEPEDFDPEFDRIKDAVTNCRRLFSDVVGCEDILDKFLGYIRTADNLKKMNLELEEYLPFNFIFKGPPGTGKTTTARKTGKIFYDMGLLGSSEVIECSVTDLVGQYIGWTGPKITQKLDAALGKVLFIDEAYRLGEGPYSLEALDELVDCLTKPRYKGKMIVVLAGYENEMNDLLQDNPGLSSRFSEEINFNNLDADSCLDLLVKKVEQIPGLKMSAVRNKSTRLGVSAAFFELSQLSGWGNGRDIETLAKRIIGTGLRSGMAANGVLNISNDVVISELKSFYDERLGRAGNGSAMGGRDGRSRRSYR